MAQPVGRALGEPRVLAHTGAGHGPRPLVLLHGFLGAGRNLATLMRLLAEREPSLSVRAFDLTGHGASPALPPGADLATVAADVLATAHALDLGSRLRFLGHSLGGRVALRARLLDPARVAHITLLDISPSPSAGDPETGAVLDALVAAPDAALSREEFRVHFRRTGLPAGIIDWLLLDLTREGHVYRWRVDREALAEFHARTSREDLWPAVESGRDLTLACIRGSRSRHVDETDARRLEAAGCRVHTIEGAGHFLHVERPVEVLARVLEGMR